MTKSATSPINHDSFVAWAAEGHRDVMGLPFSDWLVCRCDEDGRALRDPDGRVVYETQAEWFARGVLGPAVQRAPAQGTLFT